MSNITLFGTGVVRPGRDPDQGSRFDSMSYEPSPRGIELREQLLEFIENYVYTAKSR